VLAIAGAQIPTNFAKNFTQKTGNKQQTRDVNAAEPSTIKRRLVSLAVTALMGVSCLSFTCELIAFTCTT